jgi:hypothetical protein
MVKGHSVEGTWRRSSWYTHMVEEHIFDVVILVARSPLLGERPLSLTAML